MTSRSIHIGSGVALALVAVSVVWIWCVPLPGVSADNADGRTETGQGSFRAPAAMPVLVETARARRGRLVLRITASGTAEALRTLNVTSAVEGAVEEIATREGARVETGDLLVVQDAGPLRLERDRAREQVVSALAGFTEKQLAITRSFGPDTAEDGERSEAAHQYERTATDFLRGMISEEALRTILSDPKLEELFQTITRDEIIAGQVDLVAARVSYEEAELNLERARITAPFGGWIGKLRVVPGQRLSAGAEMMSLVDTDPIRVRAEVLESEIAYLREGRDAEITFAAYPDEPRRGHIEAISPVVDPERRTLEVLVTLANADGRLRPGMYAEVELDAQIFDEKLMVPRSAILIRDERSLVFVVRDERAEWVHVQTGRENPEWVEIVDGIAEDDEVITAGHFSLAHDTVVRVVEQ